MTTICEMVSNDDDRWSQASSKINCASDSMHNQTSSKINCASDSIHKYMHNQIACRPAVKKQTGFFRCSSSEQG
jgi:hypothetical protein